MKHSWVEIYSYGQEVGPHETHEGSVDAPKRALACPSVIVLENPCATGTPTITHADAHAWVGLDVPYVASLVSMLGNDPENIAL